MSSDEQHNVDRINELSQMARTSWLALLAFLAYIGITLLAVEDADFFVPTRQTELPLVGISIPTLSFFLFAPPLAAALSVYLHLHLLKLWDALAEAPPQINGRPLGERVHPWLVNDFALELKGAAALRPRPLREIGNAASRVLVWAAGPLVLALFWWRSMPAHSLSLTLLVTVSLVAALYASAVSWSALRGWLASPRRGIDERALQRKLAVLTVLLGIVGLVRTSADLAIDYDTPLLSRLPIELPISTLSRADLSGVNMVELPEAWRTPETARQAFRAVWCAREGLSMAICDHLPALERPLPHRAEQERAAWCESHPPPAGRSCADIFAELDLRFRSAWAEERASGISSLPRLDLTGRDLRRASAAGVSLVGATLEGGRLDGAVLAEARLEGARLRGASLIRADLTGARLDGAEAIEANLREATLSEARLDGAVLVGARLDGAVMSAARLEGSVLGAASLVRAYLDEARLEGADLIAANLEGADLRGAWATDTDLRSARLVKADLRGTRLTRNLLLGADLRGAYVSGAVTGPAIVHSADLRVAAGLTQAQMDEWIGDARTLLLPGVSPDTGEPYHVWSCWPTLTSSNSMLIEAMADGDPAFVVAIRKDYVCQDGEAPRRTGTLCAPDLPPERCLERAPPTLAGRK